MRLFIVSATLIAAVAASGQQAEPRALTRSSKAFAGQSDHGDLMLSARRIQTDSTYPHNRMKETGELTVIFEPNSGLLHWLYGRADPVDGEGWLGAYTSSHGKIFIDADRLVDFEMGDYKLFVRESRSHANNLEDAESKALAELRRAMVEHDGDAPVTVTKAISLFQIGNPFFFNGPMSPVIQQIKILSVTHDAGKWRLVLKGQWEQEVILDGSYSLLSTTKIAP